MGETEEQRALSPLDYQQLLVAHDQSDPYAQPHAHYWRKCKMENGKPAKRRDGSPIWVTPPIIRHTGVQRLARLFGVQVKRWQWIDRNLEPKPTVTCEVVVAGYKPVSGELASRIVGKPVTLLAEYDVPDETTGIGELNQDNAGKVGREFPQCLGFKRGFDRGVLEHLGLFESYGDSEEPGFAQGAKYEEPAAEEKVEQKAEKKSSGERERLAKWGALPDDIQEEVRMLLNGGVVAQPEMAQMCEDCNWEHDPIRAALKGWQEKASG